MPFALYCATHSLILPSDVLYRLASSAWLLSPLSTAFVINSFSSGVCFILLTNNAPFMRQFFLLLSFMKGAYHEGQPVFDGAPGEIRTHGLPLRRRPLYPAELRVQDFEKYKLQRLFCQIIIWQKTIPALYGEDIFFITERSFRTGPLETEGFPFMAYVWYIM